MGSWPLKGGQATRVEVCTAAGWSKSWGKLLSLPYAFSFIGACALLIRELALRSPLQVAGAWNSQENMRRGRFEPCLAGEGDKLTPLPVGLWPQWLGAARVWCLSQKMLTALKAPR